MRTFWKYYCGEKVAPVLTIFVGGNHEASNHLWELYGMLIFISIYLPTLSFLFFPPFFFLETHLRGQCGQCGQWGELGGDNNLPTSSPTTLATLSRMRAFAFHFKRL